MDTAGAAVLIDGGAGFFFADSTDFTGISALVLHIFDSFFYLPVRVPLC